MGRMTRAKPPLADRTTYLYRAFGTRQELLYVGISQDFRARVKGHAKRSPWWQYANHVEVEEYKNRLEAFAAESWAIKHQGPRMNYEQQSRHRPASRPEPSVSFGYRVRRRALNGDEIPAKELETDENS